MGFEYIDRTKIITAINENTCEVKAVHLTLNKLLRHFEDIEEDKYLQKIRVETSKKEFLHDVNKFLEIQRDNDQT